jgi:DUF1680 family protein
VPVDAVTLDDAFWAPRLRRNREVTIPAQHRHLEETGRLDNFRRAAGKRPDLPFQGIYFNDSDVYKWLEAASWSLVAHPDPVLAGLVDAVIAEVAGAQRPDGYLNTYFALDKADERWTNFDLHEMYCAGHLFQAAVAHHRATGSTRLLDVATRFADHICATFGPAERGKRPASDGHEEIEMALVELYRATGEERYLDQAQFFVDVRGHRLLDGDNSGRFGAAYHQDDRPFRELDAMAGHAVRAVYYTSGATDLFAERGEPAIGAALERLWRNMTTRRSYVSGALGARWEGEAFGDDFELPNARAYAETCAAIGSVMWNHRLLALDGDARYADALETALYNAVLPGISLDGEAYFYQNPLADDGGHRRQPWFGCACCPPNVARMLASLPGYVYGVEGDAVSVHLYAEGTAEVHLADGATVGLRQRARYPWDGDIAIEVAGEGEFALRLRVPAWCADGATLEVDGRPVDAPVVPGTYAEVRRTWKPGDTVRLRLPMPVRRVEGHPDVAENVGRVALMRGPLLYCLEGVDNPEADPRYVTLPPAAEIAEAFRPDLLGGVVALTAEATVAPPDAGWADKLYRPVAASGEAASPARAAVTAIPYYAWANRAAGPMRVWLRSGA